MQNIPRRFGCLHDPDLYIHCTLYKWHSCHLRAPDCQGRRTLCHGPCGASSFWNFAPVDKIGSRRSAPSGCTTVPYYGRLVLPRCEYILIYLTTTQTAATIHAFVQQMMNVSRLGCIARRLMITQTWVTIVNHIFLEKFVVAPLPICSV